MLITAGNADHKDCEYGQFPCSEGVFVLKKGRRRKVRKKERKKERKRKETKGKVNETDDTLTVNLF